MTAAQRRVLASLLFLLAAVLAGLTFVEHGVEYRAFGLVEGVFALVLTHLLVLRGAWASPDGFPGWLAISYGTLANAQALELLLPPPGMLEWVVAAGLAMFSWGALGGGTRHRTVASLGSLALLLAILKFSVIPVLWERAGPAADTPVVGGLAESVRRFFVDYQPVRPVGQVIGFLALCGWALGTRLIWPPERLTETAQEGKL
ncbi:MAG TPA: hypothetical protein VFX98_08595 [Longimicrobiaceae bacterium]|nr:hypothetical protein [Longimicrobiaceae bacterium]